MRVGEDWRGWESVDEDWRGWESVERKKVVLA